VARVLCELAEDAIITCDDHALVTSWNPAAQRLFGVDAREVLGRPWEDLFPEVRRQELRAVMAMVRSGDRITRFEAEMQRPDGMPVPLELSLCALGEPGADPGAVVIARDVTEQRLAQAALAEMEARLEESEALAHLGSWLWDVRTGAVQWSAELHRITGVDPLGFEGTLAAHLAVVHAGDRDRLESAMRAAIAHGRGFEIDVRVVRPGGELNGVQVRAQPTFDSSGTAVGLRGTARGVSPVPSAGGRER